MKVFLHLLQQDFVSSFFRVVSSLSERVAALSIIDEKLVMAYAKYRLIQEEEAVSSAIIRRDTAIVSCSKYAEARRTQLEVLKKFIEDGEVLSVKLREVVEEDVRAAIEFEESRLTLKAVW